ncbi:NlpC/P60 family protein [Flavobacterium arcticum]|uniref:NlpC/P60 family protein n=2 Tax=Flavobacterium arcticum TaxID=1784713 RepID=A0A345H9U1_9FLAO|nr:NlpC/P60 family protein [Flavobacterium arcticum]KAF2513385.1 C40 family peptidase [Flavobacterium arcticum]
MVSWESSAQIITSKKEAIENGIYSYTEEDNNTETTENSVGLSAVKPIEKTTTEEKKKRKRLIESTRPDPDFIPAPDESYIAQQVVNNVMEFEGVRYKTGGTTKMGMDCSGMVYTTFNLFNISLPRSSREMAKAGREIKLEEVKKGDLLFFDNNPRRKRINHVGLVTEVTEDGDIKFIHATLQLGVTVSSLSESYYEKSFVQANRVIED